MLRKVAAPLMALAFGAVACSSGTTNNTGAGGTSAGGRAGTSAGGTTGGAGTTGAGGTLAGGHAGTSAGGITGGAGTTGAGGTSAGGHAGTSAGGHAGTSAGGITGSAGTTGAGGSGVDNSCDAADAGATSANLLSNGGFEQPPLGSPGAGAFFAVGDSTNLPGWSVFGSAGGDCNLIQTPFMFNGFSATAAEGVQIMDLTGHNDLNGVSNVGVQQTVATVTGKTYVLSFSIGNWFDPANGLVGQTSKVAVLTNGTVVLHAVNSDMPSDKTLSWKRFCVRFVAAGPTTTIGLQCEDPVTDTADAIDGVSLVQQ